MDFDNDITKIDLPNDTAYTTFQNIWTAIQEIQSRLRFHEVDLSGSPALPPVDRVDICLRQSDSKLVAVKSDGSIVDLENSAAVSDHGTKIKDNGVLISTSARPLNLPATNAITFTEDAFNDHFTIDIAADGILDTHIGAHTSTKITIDNLGQLPSSLITETNTKTLTNKTLTAAVLDANIISTYLELTKLGADPSGNPATDRVWLYVDANEDLIFEKDTGSKTIIGGGLTSPVGIADGGTGQTSKTNAFDALSPLTTLGDIIYRNASDNIRLGIGAEGHVLTVVSGVPAWAAAGGGGGGGTEFDYIEQARNRVGFIEDFFDVVSKPGYTALLNGTGTAFVNIDTTDLGVFGVGQLTTGTTSGGEAAIYWGGSTIANQSIRLGQGITTIEAKIRIPILSTSAQRYRLIFGISDTPNDASQNEGVWFEYEEANDTTWRRSTGNDGTKTENASATTVVAATWLRLKIVVNAAASSVEFFVNGTSIGTETTNIPSGAGDEIYPLLGIFKTAGTTARVVDVDYVAFQIDLTTLR